MQDTPNPISDWLQSNLDRRGWSQSELARRAGLSSATVSDILSGNARPGFNFCRKVARAFELRTEEVLRIANLLDPLPPETSLFEQARYYFNQLSEDEKDIILSQMRALVERRERKEREKQEREQAG
jgi:transcriptional regulator with XRE-family HTH domain